MTKSFAVQNGDILVKSSSVQTVSGTDKLKQDIFVWLAEAYGVDRFHPQYGSTLSAHIGRLNTLDNAFAVEVETNRVLTNLQRYQKVLYEADPSRYQPEELLDTIIDVTATPNLDNLSLQITFATAVGKKDQLDITLEA